MTQTSNRFFDEAARLMNDAAGVAQGVRREFDTMLRHQAERILGDLDVVKREEFEAVKEMARLAREENEALKARIAALEARLEAKARGNQVCRRGLRATAPSGQSLTPRRPRPPGAISARFSCLWRPAPLYSRQLAVPAPLEACRGRKTQQFMLKHED